MTCCSNNTDTTGHMFKKIVRSYREQRQYAMWLTSCVSVNASAAAIQYHKARESDCATCGRLNMMVQTPVM